jgi:CBS domain-containing protein
MRRIAVGDIMTKDIISVTPESNLQDCVKKMAKERVDSLLVTNQKKLIGILTARDILWTLTKKPSTDLKNIKTVDIATKKLAIIKPSADLSQAIKKMQSLNFRRLPVMSKGDVIGVITLKDILRVAPELYEEISNFIDVREEDRKLLDTKEEYPEEGFCDHCGAFSELLKVYDNLLCPDCREELY